jgi:addiction module HigA family antidote
VGWGHRNWRLLTVTRRVATPITAIHPGEHLAEELEALHMSAAELARKLGVPTNRVTQILHGTRSVTGDTALRLAHFFDTSAQFWLNLQNLYDLKRAKKSWEIRQSPAQAETPRPRPRLAAISGDYLPACDLTTALARLIPAVVRGDVKLASARRSPSSQLSERSHSPESESGHCRHTSSPAL